MSLSEQLRSIEREHDGVLDQMETMVSRAEAAGRDLTDTEQEDFTELKRKVARLDHDYEIASARYRAAAARAVPVSREPLEVHTEDDSPAPGQRYGFVAASVGGSRLREALERSGLFGAIQRSGNLTGRGTLRINAKTLLTGTAAPGLLPRHGDLGAVQAQFGSAPLLGTLAYPVPVDGGIVTYSRVTIASGAAAKQSPEGSAKAHVVLQGDPKS